MILLQKKKKTKKKKKRIKEKKKKKKKKNLSDGQRLARRAETNPEFYTLTPRNPRGRSPFGRNGVRPTRGETDGGKCRGP